MHTTTLLSSTCMRIPGTELYSKQQKSANPNWAIFPRIIIPFAIHSHLVLKAGASQSESPRLKTHSVLRDHSCKDAEVTAAGLMPAKEEKNKLRQVPAHYSTQRLYLESTDITLDTRQICYLRPVTISPNQS